MAWWNWPEPKRPRCRRFAELPFLAKDGQTTTTDAMLDDIAELKREVGTLNRKTKHIVAVPDIWFE